MARTLNDDCTHVSSGAPCHHERRRGREVARATLEVAKRSHPVFGPTKGGWPDFLRLFPRIETTFARCASCDLPCYRGSQESDGSELNAQTAYLLWRCARQLSKSSTNWERVKFNAILPDDVVDYVEASSAVDQMCWRLSIPAYFWHFADELERGMTPRARTALGECCLDALLAFAQWHIDDEVGQGFLYDDELRRLAGGLLDTSDLGYAWFDCSQIDWVAPEYLTREDEYEYPQERLWHYLDAAHWLTAFDDL